MRIALSPMSGLPGQAETTISVAGDVITVDGKPYDLSAVPDGGEAWPEGEHPFEGKITRHGGKLRVTVRVVLDDTAADNQPVDGRWIIENASGQITIPAVRKAGA